MDLERPSFICLKAVLQFEIHLAVLAQFPKIADCRGYELLRTYENTKRLTVITPTPEGYTGSFLKKVLGQANCYIRQIQTNIELKYFPAIESGVEVKYILI